MYWKLWIVSISVAELDGKVYAVLEGRKAP